MLCSMFLVLYERSKNLSESGRWRCENDCWDCSMGGGVYLWE